MPQFTLTRRVHVPASVAYAVAADVASYKEFLPLMVASTIRGAKRPSGAGETFNAELVIGYDRLGIRESFVSKVVTDPVARSVIAASSEGPMQALTTSWKIVDASDGCDVTITIDYAFKSRMMQMAFAGLLDMTAPRLITAFEDRAKSMAGA